jgi:hypothetical protein
MPIGSSYTATQGPVIKTPIGSAFTSTQGPVIKTPIGSAFTYEQDPPINEPMGSSFTHTQEAPITDGIRGPQIEPYDLELDRLANITSASLAIIADIDLTSIATTPLFTATQKTYVLGVLLRVTTADTVTVVAEASIGVNPSTNDMFANEQLVNFDAVDDLYTFWNNVNTGIIMNTAEQLDLSVNTGATATSLTTVAYVIGVQL